jgi:retron-type reverse transcriptase
VNTSDLLGGPEVGPWQRVLEIQAKLHRWASDDPHRQFGDLFNLVTDPGFLRVAWDRVAGNKGARSAGVDGMTAAYVRERVGTERFLEGLRQQLRDRTFQPVPVRERMIPKPGTRKRRRLGIPTIADRVVQASLKLVLEPIFEADFAPCSYGFRPNRRAHDAVAETRFLASKTYEWVLEGDIKACFDEISHPALMDRVRERIGDKRLLALVKAFLKAGILTEAGDARETVTGTPQGGIITPPAQWITSASMSRWVTGGWNGRGVLPARGDMSGSTFMTWRVTGLVQMSMPSGSMPRWIWRTRGWGRPRLPGSLPGGSAARSGRRTATWSGPRRLGVCWHRRAPRCSPSSCRPAWPGVCGGMPARPGSPSPRWWRKPWRSSLPGAAETIRAGEQACGRDAVRLRPPCGSGIVSGLRDSRASTAGSHLAGRPGRTAAS